MKNIPLLLLFSTLLIAQYPSIYSVLGDKIYSNTYNIAKLKEVKAYTKQTHKIDKYIIEVDELRQEGLVAQNSSNPKDKITYLKKLREYSKINDFYNKSAKESFKSSLQNNDFSLFSKIINSGIIDVENNRHVIMQYYYKHKENIAINGVIKKFLDEDKKIKRDRQKAYISKNRLKEEKIKRLRKNDILKKEAIKREINKETQRKKIEVREEQKKNSAN